MWLHLDKPNAQVKQVAWQVVVKGGKPAFAALVMAAPSRAGRGSSRGELASLEQQGRRRGLGNGWEGGRGRGVGRRGGLRGYFQLLQGGRNLFLQQVSNIFVDLLVCIHF